MTSPAFAPSQAASAELTASRAVSLSGPESRLGVPRMFGVQLLRGVAALAVVVHHTLEESSLIIRGAEGWTASALVGAAGVDVFFVISGFIMLHSSWSSFGREGAARGFLLRRVLRVLPLYWTCLFAVLALKLLGLYASVELTPRLILTSFCLWPAHRLLIPAAWTLIFEMYFYLLFSLFLARRWPWAVVGIPCLGSFVALAAEHWLPAGDLRDYLSNPIFYEFCYGLALAAVARKVETSWSAARLFVLAALGFAAAAIWHAFAHPQLTDGLVRSVRFVLWGAPAALAVAGALALREGRGVGMRVAAALGDASYAIYLTHGFVMTAYARALKSEGVAALLPPAVWIALVLAAVVVLGWCAHVLVERRLTAWIKPLLRSA